MTTNKLRIAYSQTSLGKLDTSLRVLIVAKVCARWPETKIESIALWILGFMAFNVDTSDGPMRLFRSVDELAIGARSMIYSGGNFYIQCGHMVKTGSDSER